MFARSSLNVTPSLRLAPARAIATLPSRFVPARGSELNQRRPHIQSRANLSSSPRNRLALLARTMSWSSAAAASQIPTQMRAAQIQEQGDIGVIQVRQVDVPKPGPGQVLVRVEYAGNNFIDT